MQHSGCLGTTAISTEVKELKQWLKHQDASPKHSRQQCSLMLCASKLCCSFGSLKSCISLPICVRRKLFVATSENTSSSVISPICGGTHKRLDSSPGYFLLMTTFTLLVILLYKCYIYVIMRPDFSSLISVFWWMSLPTVCSTQRVSAADGGSLLSFGSKCISSEFIMSKINSSQEPFN